jgi:hypothetical protein
MLGGKMKLLFGWSLLALLMFSAADSHALPAFMRRFSEDPFSKTEWRAQCATCHVNPGGGGPRNDFGQAFDKNGRMITPEFRAAWPDHFNMTVDAAPAGPVKTTFVNGGKEAVLVIGGESYRLNTAEGKLEKLTPEQVAQLTGASAAATTTAASAAAPGDQPLRNQPTFDHVLVNLPTTLPYEKGAFSMHFTHRFTQPVLRVGGDCPHCGSLPELFGLDSLSYSSFGGEYAVTSRLVATVYRSPLDRTYEFGGILQLLNGKGNEPVAAQARLTLESRRLFDIDKVIADPSANPFSRFQTLNVVFPVSHAVSNVAELSVVPTFSFRANHFDSLATTGGDGEGRRNQTAIGLGASIRLRPRTAFIAEWTPRVAGYHATDSRNSFSFGLQRSTNAHVFSLVLTNTVATTTSQSIASGTPELRLGFNIYRRLH